MGILSLLLFLPMDNQIYVEDTIIVYEEQLKADFHESAKVIEKHAVQLSVLAKDCNEPDYIKLMKGSCANYGVGLFSGSQC